MTDKSLLRESIAVALGVNAPRTSTLDTAVGLATMANLPLRIIHVNLLRDYPIDPDSPEWEREGGKTVEMLSAWVSEELAKCNLAYQWHVEKSKGLSCIIDFAMENNAKYLVIGAPRLSSNHKIANFFTHFSHKSLGRPRFPLVVAP
ncbi:MAG: hypothetical protein M0Z45_01655 [Actinomycetota bacterium]|nr:hypothetical protein [Actinomycetota bacterium]